MINIILCGGSGTRLWPLSREKKPKQFINFSDGKSLLQSTVAGNQKCCSDFMIIGNAEHSYATQQQMAELGLTPKQYIFESLSKNTATAACLGALAIDPDEIALITPADHYIGYSEEYYEAIARARQLAEQNELVIFGIPPKFPDTGFGYIEVAGKECVKRFHEKPDADTASRYLEQGYFYWNSGMVCVKARVLLEAMHQYMPSIFYPAEKAYQNAVITNNQYKIPSDRMAHIPSQSLDHALLEKMPSLKCVVGNFEWSDIGSFDSLFKHLPKDVEGNAVEAKKFASLESSNNLIMGSNRMISLLDVENLVIIDTPDALLISKLGSTQKVKHVVDKLKTTQTTLHRDHLEDSRPWGTHVVLEEEEDYKVKRLVVSPGKRLSLQKHQHRSEHWVVVAGFALVTIGEEQQLLYPNQSIYIPLGAVHRVQNIGVTDLVIIEVQYGEYVREDDIIRIEDDFARTLG